MSIRTEEEINETTQSNEMTASSQIKTETLDDLQVEEDEQVKGGPGGFGSGGLYLNHNETTAEDDEADANALADLPVTQANKIRGGITDPAETTPSLRPPPPKLPPDAPKPISS